jgi:hypothetical protein
LKGNGVVGNTKCYINLRADNNITPATVRTYNGLPGACAYLYTRDDLPSKKDAK